MRFAEEQLDIAERDWAEFVAHHPSMAHARQSPELCKILRAVYILAWAEGCQHGSDLTRHHVRKALRESREATT